VFVGLPHQVTLDEERVVLASHVLSLSLLCPLPFTALLLWRGPKGRRRLPCYVIGGPMLVSLPCWTCLWWTQAGGSKDVAIVACGGHSPLPSVPLSFLIEPLAIVHGPQSGSRA